MTSLTAVPAMHHDNPPPPATVNYVLLAESAIYQMLLAAWQSRRDGVGITRYEEAQLRLVATRAVAMTAPGAPEQAEQAASDALIASFAEFRRLSARDLDHHQYALAIGHELEEAEGSLRETGALSAMAGYHTALDRIAGGKQ